MCLGTILKEVNRENFSCKTFIKHFNRFNVWRRFKIGIPHLNDFCFLLEFLGAAAHIVLTELDDQKLFSHGMASIKSTDSYIS